MNLIPVQAGMNFDLHRMRQVMEELGNPQNSFPAVHVVGTNGKGSVTAMITQALTEAGYTAGMYTSPHLETVHERFRIGQSLITPAEFHRLARIIKNRSTKLLTEFEFHTALAFLWFSLKKVDVAVLEAGLGGRLDATNIVQHVLVSVITNIDLEHKEWLGNTVEKIAFEKAGVIKVNTPVVTASRGTTVRVIERIASQQNAPLIILKGLNRMVSTRLVGGHQKRNAALSFETVRILQEFFPKCTPQVTRRALQNVFWPGRFERVILRINKKKKVVILDGAHNPAATRVLVQTLKEEGINHVNLLFGVMKDKESKQMVRTLSPFINDGYVVRVPSNRSADPSKLVSLIEWRGKMKKGTSIKSAFEDLMQVEDQRPLLVTGSLYLVGAVRAYMKLRKDMSE